MKTQASRQANNFGGATVACFESRMADALAQRVTECGGRALSAPAMREVPLVGRRELLTFAERLLVGDVDVVIFMTGVGATLMLDAVSQRHERHLIVEALSRTTVVARGPKSVMALREFGVPVTIVVPEPSTWRELVHELELDSRGVDLADHVVAIQEYGTANEQLVSALEARGAEVIPVSVYRRALPEDTQPLSDAVHEIIDGQVHMVLFTNGSQVKHLVQLAASEGHVQRLRKAFSQIPIASIGPRTSETITEQGFRVDLEASRPTMDTLVNEAAGCATALIAQKRNVSSVHIVHSQPGTETERNVRDDTPFMRACRRQPTEVTPVWLMRQAGRYMKEYRDIRNKVPFLELCKTPELVAEVTVTAVETIQADAAILFSDILLVAEPMGLGLEYTATGGPVLSGQVETLADVDRLREIQPEETLSFVFEGVRQTRSALRSNVPLIGFSGAPFTLAAYIIEGGSSRSFLNTKRLMYADPGAWHALMDKLSRGLVRHLNGQIAAGVDAVQLFDSWVGCLGPQDYREFVMPHTRAVIQGITPGVPVIHFGTGTAPFLNELREAGGDVIGVDFRVELDQAWQGLGPDVAIQGNLDPVVLCSSRDQIRSRAKRILDQAGGRPGHIFNLGHGVLPQTPVEHVQALIDCVHELSQRSAVVWDGGTA